MACSFKTQFPQIILSREGYHRFSPMSSQKVILELHLIPHMRVVANVVREEKIMQTKRAG